MHSFQRALQFSPCLQQYGSNEVMKLFLSHRANVNARDGHGATALVMATWSDNVEGVRILCEGKVDIPISKIGRGCMHLQMLEKILYRLCDFAGTASSPTHAIEGKVKTTLFAAAFRGVWANHADPRGLRRFTSTRKS